MLKSIIEVGDGYILNNLPMPPTSNQIYASVAAQKNGGRFIINKNGKRVRNELRIKSEKLQMFESDMLRWHMLNRMKTAAMAKDLQNQIQDNYGLFFKRVFCFTEKCLYTRKTNRVKELDVTNRIKALDDALANLLNIDDRHIWQAQEAKIVVEELTKPMVIVLIKKVTRLNFKTIQEVISRDFLSLPEGSIKE